MRKYEALRGRFWHWKNKTLEGIYTQKQKITYNLPSERTRVSTVTSLTHCTLKKEDKFVSLNATNIYIYIYTGCPRRNVPDFGKVFLMLKYTDITQNTHVLS